MHNHIDDAIEAELLKFVQAGKQSLAATEPDSVLFQVYDQLEASILAEQVRRKLSETRVQDQVDETYRRALFGPAPSYSWAPDPKNPSLTITTANDEAPAPTPDLVQPSWLRVDLVLAVCATALALAVWVV